MVCRVKAGELCGTIAGLPWHQKKTERRGKEGEEEEEEEKDQRIQQGPGGVFWDQRGFLCLCGGGRVQGGITTRGGRSSWIEMRESSVRCYTTGKYVQ